MQFKDKSKPDFSLLDTYNYNWNHKSDGSL